jgi:putative oxidoreductase
MTKQHFQLFRSFTSLIFIYAGIKHLTNPQGIFKRLSSSTIYELIQNEWLFRNAILFSGAVMVMAGMALLIGYKSRSAAWLLLATLIPITLSTQLENLNDLGPFFKNVAIAGSLLLIINRKKHEIKNDLSDNSHAVHQPSVLHAEIISTEKR